MIEQNLEITTLCTELAAARKQICRLTLERDTLMNSARQIPISELSEHLLSVFDSEYFALAVIHTQAEPSTRHHAQVTDSMFNQAEPLQRERDIYYSEEAFAVVEDLCQKHLEPMNNSLVFHAEKSIAILINPKASYISETRIQGGYYVTELKWALLQLLLVLDQQLGFKSVITLSSVVQQPLNLHMLYLENKYTFDYIWDCVGGVHAYPDLNAAPMSSKELTELSALEQEFMDNVTRALYQGAETTLNRILQRRFQHVIPLHELVSNAVNKLRTIMAIIEYSSDGTSVYISELDVLLQHVTASASIPELLDRIRDFFACLATFSPKQNANKGQQVLAFIKNNYKNPRLNAQMICDRFRISRNYLSNLLKKQTGQGLVDLLHGLRVEAAKGLLLGTNLTVDQVAQQVGFSNRYSLIRAFRDCAGTTPSEYRAQNS